MQETKHAQQWPRVIRGQSAHICLDPVADGQAVSPKEVERTQ